MGLKSLLRLAKVLKGKVHINFHWPDFISTEILSVNLLRQLQRKSSWKWKKKNKLDLYRKNSWDFLTTTIVRNSRIFRAKNSEFFLEGITNVILNQLFNEPSYIFVRKYLTLRQLIVKLPLQFSSQFLIMKPITKYHCKMILSFSEEIMSQSRWVGLKHYFQKCHKVTKNDYCQLNKYGIFHSRIFFCLFSCSPKSSCSLQ